MQCRNSRLDHNILAIAHEVLSAASLSAIAFPTTFTQWRCMSYKIFATFPNLKSKELGCYTLRGCAENDALRFKRFLGATATVRVMWVSEP